MSNLTANKMTTKDPATGQSLVEFVLVLPILLLILVGGFSFGMGAYEALLASDAVQMPSLGKLAFSNQASNVGSATLVAYMNGTTPLDDGETIKIQGSLNTGKLIDSVNVINSSQYTSLMVGAKTFRPIASFVPGFTVHVAQAINKNLLQSANNGAEVRPYNTPWVPGGTPNPPPW